MTSFPFVPPKTKYIFDANSFLTTWEAAYDGDTILFPAVGTGFRILWQNNDDDEFQGTVIGNETTVITLPKKGLYTLAVIPDPDNIYFGIQFGKMYDNGIGGTGSNEKIKSIDQWGTIKWPSSMSGAFYNCVALEYRATDKPKLQDVKDMSYMFCGAALFNGNIGNWDVGNVTNMSEMFSNAKSFNQDIGKWNVGNVEEMQYMFQNAILFNQNIGNWNMEKVRNTSFMFQNAVLFNQDLSEWDVSLVSNMWSMFEGTSAFNQSLGTWPIRPMINLERLLFGSGMDCKNYSNTLIGWCQRVADVASPFADNVTLGAFGLKYGGAAVKARSMLIAAGWYIDDEGLDPSCNPDSSTTGTTQLPLTAAGSSPQQTSQPPQTQADPIPFVSTWESTKNGDTIIFPATKGHDFKLEWVNKGDSGIKGSIVGNGITSVILPAKGEYTFSVTLVSATAYFGIRFGEFRNNQIVNLGSNDKIKSIDQWGGIKWSSIMYGAFFNCINLECFATDVPDFSEVTDMALMFRNAERFNGDISNWNVKKVSSMHSMFSNAKAFNQNIGAWDVSNVNLMQAMFKGASSFNQNISAWNVAKVTDLGWMFNDATAFNQNIGAWNVSKVTQMTNLFKGAASFNQNLGAWNVANVTDMSWMFDGAGAFNQPIGAWDVRNVKTMQAMFKGASSFNQPIGAWNVANVTDMSWMFDEATSFNQNINGWNVSKVLTLYCFLNGAQSFNSNLGAWRLNSKVNLDFALAHCGQSCQQYSQTLIGWSQTFVTARNHSVKLKAYGLKYGLTATMARTNLIAKGWDIQDAGPDSTCS